MRLPLPTGLVLTTLLVILGLAQGAQEVQEAQAHFDSSSSRSQPVAIRDTGRVTDVRFSIPSQLVHAWSTFDATFTVSDRGDRIRLALTPNEDIVSDATYVQHIGADGRPRGVAEPIKREEHRVFKGNAFVQDGRTHMWREAGWARIVVLGDGEAPVFEGAFSIDGDYHHVQTRRHFEMTSKRAGMPPNIGTVASSEMVVWRDSDVAKGEAGGDDDDHSNGELKKRGGTAGECGVDTLHMATARGIDTNGFTSIDSVGSFEALNRLTRRQVDTIGSTAGCPTTRRVALVGIATDCTYTASFGTAAEARSNIVAQVNSASGLFERTFNVTLAIRNLTVSDSACPSALNDDNRWNQPCSAGLSVSTRLSHFSAWRGRQRDTNAFWTLLSTCTTNSAVGIAWLGALCLQGARRDSSGTSVAGANYVTRARDEWQVLAHEIGHTFGADHDCTASTCPSASSSTGTSCCPLSRDTCDARGQFLMNPSTSGGNVGFSPCSIGSVCSQIGSGAINTRCLVDNRNVPTASDAAVCGNGVVEPGEQCDSDSACCDRSTCRYRAGAICDPASDGCCTAQCGVAPAGRVCRSSAGSCDPQETCDGTSHVCPADVNNTPESGGRTCTTNNGNNSGSGGDVGGSITSWIDQNRNIVIGVGAGVGGLVVLLVAWCVFRSCRRRRRLKRQQRQMIAAQAARTVGGAGGGGFGGYGGFGGPAPQMASGPLPPPLPPPLPVRGGPRSVGSGHGAGGGPVSPVSSHGGAPYYRSSGPPAWPPPARTLSARYA